METAVLDRAHLVGMTTPEHLVHETVIVALIIARIDAFKPVPVLGKELFKDVPALRGLCSHQAAPSWRCWNFCGDALVPRLTHSVHPLLGFTGIRSPIYLTLEP